MRTRESYEEGISLGRDYAVADDLDDMPFASTAEELRADALEAETPRSWRAFKLGIVRGYRDVVRTYRAGRWGT